MSTRSAQQHKRNYGEDSEQDVAIVATFKAIVRSFLKKGHLSKGDTSRSWPGDTNVDDKSNSLTARKRHLMWPRKEVSATVFHGHWPVKFGLKKSVVLWKLLTAFLFTDAERTEFAAHFRGKVNLEKIPTAVPFSKEEAFGKDGVLPRLCVPLSPHSCRKLISPFLHVQSGKVSDVRACRAEAQGVICAGGHGAGEWLYGVGIKIIRLSAAHPKQVVKFPCGTLREITFEQLQEYAADFPWLDGFPKLRDGTSRVVWRCVVTISPVFVLGRVGEFGASMSQWAGMRQHLKDYQPNEPDIDNHTLLIPTSRRKRGASTNSVGLVVAVSAVEVDAGGLQRCQLHLEL